MQHTLIKLIAVFVLTFFTSCSKYYVEKSDKLHLPKTAYLGNQLRIDGYYYQFHNDQFFDITLFYDDGTALFPMGLETNLINVDNYIINSFVNKDDYKNVMYWWGVFNIDEDNILFERWYPSEAPYKAYINEGKIINDTTFIISNRYRIVDGVKTEIKEVNDEYHFRQFSPKPDSTNTFMNNFLR